MDAVRLVLNPDTRKELVICQRRRQQVLQIWKRGILQDEFSDSEVFDLLALGKGCCEKITKHLKSESLDEPCSFSVGSHTVRFIILRDKGFLAIERDDHFEEVNGVPVFKEVHIGLTAWTALCENISLFEHHYAPDETD